MKNPQGPEPLDELKIPTSISIRTARENLGSLVDEVADGSPALICRRSTPVAVLLPATQYEDLAEMVRRERSLAAILRASGVQVGTWSTAEILAAVVRLLEEPR